MSLVFFASGEDIPRSSLSYDGTGDALRIADSTLSFSNRRQFWFSAWVNIASLPAGGIRLFAESPANGVKLTFGGSDGGKLQINFQANGTGCTLRTTGGATGSFVHYAVVINTFESTATNRVKAWVDGSAQSLSLLSGSLPAQNSLIDSASPSGFHYVGASDSLANNSMNGLIYQFAAGNASSVSIDDLYRGGRPRDVKRIATCASVLDVSSGSERDDGILGALAWSKIGNPTTSSTIPS